MFKLLCIARKIIELIVRERPWSYSIEWERMNNCTSQFARTAGTMKAITMANMWPVFKYIHRYGGLIRITECDQTMIEIRKWWNENTLWNVWENIHSILRWASNFVHLGNKRITVTSARASFKRTLNEKLQQKNCGKSMPWIFAWNTLTQCAYRRIREADSGCREGNAVSYG